MKRRVWLEYLPGILAAAISFATYLFTLSDGAYPGEFAILLAQRLGVLPRMSPDFPLYDLLTALFASGAVASAVTRLNWLSAVCGAAGVWLMYDVVRRALIACVDEEERDSTGARAAGVLGGAVAALSLAFCAPFWTVATRAHPATLDLAMLLLAAWLLISYLSRGSRWAVLLLALVYGAGTAEFATFVMFAPAFGLTVLYFLWQRNDLRLLPILQILGCVLLGLALYLVAAWRFCGSVGYEMREYRSFWQVLQIILRDQYLLLAHSLPTRGWLMIVVLTVLPWLTGMAVARRGLNGERDWAYYLLHVVLTGLAFTVLLNAQIAPWRFVGTQRLLVTPYALTAALAGYLAAYWFRLPTAWWRDEQEGVREWARRWLGPLMALPLAGLVVACPFLNLRECDGRPAGDLNRLAADMVRSLEGRNWLISDGSVDSHLLLAARAQGIPLRVIDTQTARSAVYMKYVSRFFAETRLKNLSEIGLFPMLEEWFRTEQDVEKKVAIMGVPDLWEVAGYFAVPRLLFYAGQKDEPSGLDARRMFDAHQAFWDRELPRLRRMAACSGPLGATGKHLLRNMSLTANNLGVWLEDTEARKEAFSAYQRAHEIDSSNLSALLNLSAMARNGWSAADADGIRKEIEALLARKEFQSRLWDLSRYYGIVRAPEAFAEMGWNWALSGRRGVAVSRIKKAIALAPEEKQDDLKRLLAEVYLMQEDGEKGEQIYREMLDENPKNAGALLALARLAVRRKSYGEAETLFRQAAAAGAPEQGIELELAALAQSRGQCKEARVRIEKLLEKQPDLLRGWVALASVMLELKDEEGVQKCLIRMNALPGGSAYSAAVRADLALRQNDLAAVRSASEQMAAAMPNAARPLMLLLRLDLVQGKTDQAESHVRKLLNLDPSNAMGNYVAGILQVRRGEPDLAEDSFRTSLKAQWSAAAMNDLAWLLQEKKNYVEAEKLAREVISRDEKLYQTWDTLGVVFMRTGRLEEAGQAFEKSLSIAQSEPAVFLHMAELHALRGNKDQSRQLLQMLYGKIAELAPADQKRLNDISRALDTGKAPEEASP